MKAGLFLSALSLIGVAVAQPHGRRYHGHVHKRDAAVATGPSVVVYVDQNGTPYSTSTVGQVAATQKPKHKKHKHTTASTTSAAAAATKAAVKDASTDNSDSTSTSGLGITYSPYNDDGSCKTQAQVNSDFTKINGYSIVRLYGTDCDQVSTVLSAANSKGIKLMLGVYDISQVSSEISTIIDAASNSWDSIDTISIGNEVVNSGGSVSDVVSAISTARGLLKSTGFSGSVVTVDTFVAIIANPELCQASDYAAANCHAFFDGGVTASGAGAFVADQAQQVKSACGGMRTVITESGWPSQGTSNGAAVPSVENQQTAISSLESHFSDDLFLFTAFNDMWKTASADTFYAEQYWGIIN